MIRLLKTYPLTLLVLTAIVFLSMFNPPQTELNSINGIDKIAHICMYGGLELVIWFDYVRHHDTIEWKKMLVWGIVAPMLFGGVIELAQAYLTKYRGGDWLDLAADIAGVLGGLAFGYWVIRPLLRRNG